MPDYLPWIDRTAGRYVHWVPILGLPATYKDTYLPTYVVTRPRRLANWPAPEFTKKNPGLIKRTPLPAYCRIGDGIEAHLASFVQLVLSVKKSRFGSVTFGCMACMVARDNLWKPVRW